MDCIIEKGRDLVNTNYCKYVKLICCPTNEDFN